MAVSLMNPAVILYRNDLQLTVCVEVNGSIGPSSPLSLQNVDPSGGTQSQLWQFGSDGRIYLYKYGPNDPVPLCIGLQDDPSEENPLVLVNVDPSGLDKTQCWQLNTTVPSLTNVKYPNYCMNDDTGKGLPGDAVIIYTSSANPANDWVFSIYPDFPGQPTAA
jgi:hypothetical protein